VTDPVAIFKHDLIIEKYKNLLIPMCHGFMEKYKLRPTSYRELKEFLDLQQIELKAQLFAKRLR
jgi:hypothetical protein